MNMQKVIGIDLGTTYSCVAYLEGRKPRVIPNIEGAPTTPSVVSFTSTGEKLIGNLALRQAVTNPENTFYAVKRLMGKKFQDEAIREAKKRIPFRLIEAPNGDAWLQLNSKNITPQEISSMILGYLKKCAESYFGEDVKEAVLTVPAHFNDHQRQATKDAAEIAGLEVIRVINEPTAASLAYGFDKKKNGKIAVYDLGGGTFDITLLEISDGVFHVLATNGDTYLGGEDFDIRIVDWIIEEFRKDNKIDLSENKFALQRIKEAAEKAKRELSFKLETEIHLPFITSEGSSSKHIKIQLTRKKLEDLTRDLILKTLPYIDQAFQDCTLSLEEIDEVILVGGQSRMPLVQSEITKYFQKPPVKHINPDEIVAMGAAVQSGIIQGKMADLVVLLDVTPIDLGIEVENGDFVKIIGKNTTIPTKKTKAFTTVENNQRRVKVHVLQGESAKASENISLGVFDLVGIEPATAGVPQIDVTFEIDSDGIVKVSARDVASDRKHAIEVRPSSGLSKMEIEEIKHQDKTHDFEGGKNGKTGLL